MDAPPDAFYVCTAPVAVDGSSILCGSKHLHLLGIEAPQVDCPKGQECVPGDASASRKSLGAALRLGPVRYQFVANDRSGKSRVLAWAGKVNLS